MNLLTPVTLGSVSLENRVLMAPLTRMRADNEGVPSPLAAEYYAQRASAGLIISEATQIAELGKGYPDRKSTRLNSSHEWISRMPSSA